MTADEWHNVFFALVEYRTQSEDKGYDDDVQIADVAILIMKKYEPEGDDE